MNKQSKELLDSIKIELCSYFLMIVGAMFMLVGLIILILHYPYSGVLSIFLGMILVILGTYWTDIIKLGKKKDE